jgi:hypothetical protein
LIPSDPIAIALGAELDRPPVRPLTGNDHLGVVISIGI